jgi:uncharacterized zinc-type alcohol dehydrogenase-like protein
MYQTKAYSATSAASPLASATIPRRDPNEQDVQIEILFCGICHSGLHQVRNEWSDVMPTVRPCVPGHEIVGRVSGVGSAVTKFKPGDLAAVGCLVDSDRTCPECQDGLEQFCPNLTLTYNFPDKHLGGVAYGGYSESVVVDGRFVLRLPGKSQSRRSRASTLRRDHNLLTLAPLGSHQRQEGRRSGPWRTGPYGREIRSCAGSSRRCLYHLS